MKKSAIKIYRVIYTDKDKTIECFVKGLNLAIKTADIMNGKFEEVTVWIAEK